MKEKITYALIVLLFSILVLSLALYYLFNGFSIRGDANIIKKYYDKSVEIGCKYLIANSLGNQMKYSNYRREKWDKMMEQLELNKDHKPHDTRHTFSTMMDRTPANKLCTKRILGHSSTDITEKVYTHKDIKDLIEAVNYLD